MKRVNAILTTTHQNDAYGGIRFTRSMLSLLAEAVKAGSIPMTRNHDARSPMHVVPVDAGVRQRDDGEYEAWAIFDVDDEDWEQFDTQRRSVGVPGGMSFTFSTTFAEFVGAESPQLEVEIHADAHHFSEEQLFAAGRELSETAVVRVGHLYQFEAEPVARVIVELLVATAAQLPPGVLGNYLYDVIKHFFRRDKTSPALELRVEEGGRAVTAVIPLGTPEDVAKRALEAFENVAIKNGGLWEHAEEGWRELKRREG